MSTTKARRRDSVRSIPRSLPTTMYPPEHPQALPPPVMAPLHPFVLPFNAKHIIPLSAVLSAARRFRLGLRPSFVGLLALLALTAFCLLHQHLNDTPHLSRLTPHHPPSPSRQSTPLREHAWHRTLVSKPLRPKIALAPEEELAAVIAFIAALPSNALPNSIDPLIPIDPDLVLDFDTRTQKAAREVHQLVGDTWTRLPLVLLSKRYSPAAREIRKILAEFNLNPAPAVFDLDERADAPVLTPLLFRLTAAADLPVLIIAGKPIGSLEKIRELHASGELRTMVATTSAVIDGAKKRKKGRRAAHA